MNIINHPDCNTDKGRPSAEMTDVSIATLPVQEGVSAEGYNVMVSYWQPSAEELAELNAKGFVTLWVFGKVHPVVAMGTTAPLPVAPNVVPYEKPPG